MTRYLVPAVVSANGILQYLATDAPEGATHSEIAQALGLSKSSAHNLLGTLEEIGWVQRNEARAYLLGSRLIGLGAAATRRISVVGLAVRRLATFAHEYGLSFAVAQLTPEGDAQVVERIYPSSDEHVGIAIGSRYGDFAGALGKAILALESPETARELVEGTELRAFTTRTITDPEALLAEAAEIRGRGWAASEGELNDNRAVVGYSRSSDPAQQVFLLGLGFPSQLPHERVVALGERLAALARELNEEVGLAAG